MVTEKKGMECCARVSSRSWRETSTQRAAIYEGDNAPPEYFEIKCPRLAKNAYVMQHLLHHSIIYTFIYYHHTMNEDGCNYRIC
jgi:hypothetical protein